MKTHRPPPKSESMTLAAIVRAQQPDLSWNKCRDLIANGRVSVAGKIVYDATSRFDATTPIVIGDRGVKPPKPLPNLLVYFYDAHLIVVEKPSAMETVPFHTKNDQDDRASNDDTLIDVARKWLEITEKRKSPPLRVVHRIDKGTSGIVAFARTPAAEKALGAQFREHSLHRKYLAICVGSPAQETISSSLIEDRGDGYRGSTSAPKIGKHAVTHVEILGTSADGYTLVACTIETGRTHQIRIHLCEAGHPICGDAVYRSPKLGTAKIPDRSGASRLALHAAELGIAHPLTGKLLQYTSPLPADLTLLWNTLGGPPI